MKALIDDYGLETVWAVALLLLFLNAPARAQSETTKGWESTIGQCPNDSANCQPPE